MHAKDLKVGDKVEVRHVHTKDQTWYRGTIESTDVFECTSFMSDNRLSIKLDEGQGRSFVVGKFSTSHGEMDNFSSIEVRLPVVVPDFGKLTDYDEKIHMQKPRDAKGRFVKQMVEA